MFLYETLCWCPALTALVWARQGATVVDFAYHVHTDVGNQMVGVKVSCRLLRITAFVCQWVFLRSHPVV